MLHGCVPVVIMDQVNAVFKPELDWSSFSIRVKESEAEQVGEGGRAAGTGGWGRAGVPERVADAARQGQSCEGGRAGQGEEEGCGRMFHGGTGWVKTRLLDFMRAASEQLHVTALACKRRG